jgi:hypothetical protein
VRLAAGNFDDAVRGAGEDQARAAAQACLGEHVLDVPVDGALGNVSRGGRLLAGVPGRDRGQDADLALRQVGAVTAAPAFMRAVVVGSHVVLLIAQAMALMLSPPMAPPVVNVRLAIDHPVRRDFYITERELSRYQLKIGTYLNMHPKDPG